MTSRYFVLKNNNRRRKKSIQIKKCRFRRSLHNYIKALITLFRDLQKHTGAPRGV